MPRSAWKRASGQPLTALALCALLCPVSFGLAAHQPPRLAVMDIALTGDAGGPELIEQHETRARMASDRLRAALARTRLYEIADNMPALDMIAQLESTQYLHKCNGCELDIARELDAQQVLVAWVYRVSNLILTLNFEIRDAVSGEVVTRSSFSFRGDNDAAWTRAVEYLVRDLQERTASRPR